jgi:hypothetical protein
LKVSGSLKRNKEVRRPIVPGNSQVSMCNDLEK